MFIGNDNAQNVYISITYSNNCCLHIHSCLLFNLYVNCCLLETVAIYEFNENVHYYNIYLITPDPRREIISGRKCCN